jgi:hypothetical protein
METIEYKTGLDVVRDDRFPYLDKLPMVFDRTVYSFKIILNQHPLKPFMHKRLLKERDSKVIIGVLADHCMKVARFEGVDPKFIQTFHEFRKRRKFLREESAYSREKLEKESDMMRTDFIAAQIKHSDNLTHEIENRICFADVTVNFIHEVASKVLSDK